ncbi:MAG: hypothetical protein HF981_02750 [Desulfobacteraceae bacterium]|nr:hypothetical protein [Desulfobacteraceae bacterium]MBC2749283.1 hypothetical protein [Desulfobacteraceae bacterium]
MRLVWRLTAIVIMILPRAVEIVMADEFGGAGVSSSHPAWSSIESPVLVMLGCILVWLAGLCRKKFNQKSNRDHHAPGYSQQTN